jgi:hypothetical protein
LADRNAAHAGKGKTDLMKKLLLACCVALVAWFAWQGAGPGGGGPARAVRPATGEQVATSTRQGQVEGTGMVSRILSDDDNGSRHQRFILRLPSGQTLLVAHNIDLAPRIDDLDVGDTVAYSGEYEWNPQGGVVHWTHRDPAGRHVAGWLKHDGRVYQ